MYGRIWALHATIRAAARRGCSSFIRGAELVSHLTVLVFSRSDFLLKPLPLESDVMLKRCGLALNPCNFTLNVDFKAEVLASLGFHLAGLGSFGLPNLSLRRLHHRTLLPQRLASPHSVRAL